MDQVLAIMLIVGCSGDRAVCNEVPTPIASYESVAECNRALPLQLRFTTTQDDKVYGACTGIAEDMLDMSATLEWSITNGGALTVEVVPAEVIELAGVESEEADQAVVAAR